MSNISRNKTKIKHKIESLERESELLREELEDELKIAREKVIDIGKIALGIGGGLIFSAIVLRTLIGRKSNYNESKLNYGSRRVYHRFRDQLIHELSTQATGLMLGIVKDQLKAYKKKTENMGNEDADISG